MGLTHSPKDFTTVLKPIFARLWSRGHVSSAYIDDSCLQGSSYHLCQQNIEETVQLMDTLGMTVQQHKSVFEPIQQNLSHGLGFPTMWYVRPAKPQIRLRIRAVWSEPLLVARLLIEHHLEFLSLKGGCKDSSESTLVKMSHATSHFFLGFLLCSVTMTVQLPPERWQEIIKLCINILL